MLMLTQWELELYESLCHKEIRTREQSLSSRGNLAETVTRRGECGE